MYHIPVLLHPTVDALDIKPDGTYVDLTFGGGGHSGEILARLGKKGRLYSFDQDADAAANAPQADERFTFVHSNFRHLARWMRYYEVEQVDGILADLGVSSHHFDEASRGFSFRYDAPLDMRMNQRAQFTAATLVNTYTEQQLADVLHLYGELRSARRLAALIVRARGNKELHTVQELLNACLPALDKRQEKKEMARLFQALRIEVNHEMQALREMLDAAVRCLRPGGRLSILTYHSLEDRMVKNVIRAGNVEGRVQQDFFGRSLSPLRAINNKPILPSPEEIEENPRSRSAKLRAAEKLPQPASR